jgi:hypothetical protein
MAHYAFLDQNNIVTEVIVGKDENSEFRDWEKFYGNIRQQTCVRTSYNTQAGVYIDPNTGLPAADQSKALRKNYAGVGFRYDTELDAFIPPQPYSSWVLVTETCQWEPPTPMPDDGNNYHWDEDTQTWIMEIIDN